MRTYVKCTMKQRNKMAEHESSWSQFALYRAWKTTGKAMSRSQLKIWLEGQDRSKITLKPSKTAKTPQQKSVAELSTKLFPFESGKQEKPWVDQFGDLYEREDVERNFSESIKIVKCQIDRSSLKHSGENFIDVHTLSRKLRLLRKSVVMTVVGVYPTSSASQISINCVKTNSTDLTCESFVLMSDGFRGEMRPGFVPKFSYANDTFIVEVAFAARSNRASNIYSLNPLAHSLPLRYYFNKTMTKFDVSDDPLITFSFVPQTVVTDITLMYKPQGTERLTISVCKHGDNYDRDLQQALSGVSNVKAKLVDHISNIKDEEKQIELQQLRAYSENSKMVDYSYMITGQHDDIEARGVEMFYMVNDGLQNTYESGSKLKSGPVTVTKCTIYDADELPTRYSVIVALGSPEKKSTNNDKKAKDVKTKKTEKVKEPESTTSKNVVVETSTPELSDDDSETKNYTQKRVMTYINLLSYAKQVVFLTA